MTSAGAGFGLYFLFFIVLWLCTLPLLVWKVVAHVVLPGAVPGEQHSLHSMLSSLSAPLMRAPTSLPFMTAAFSFFPLFRSLVLGHFFLGTKSTARFSRFVAFLTLEGCFVLVYLFCWPEYKRLNSLKNFILYLLQR